MTGATRSRVSHFMNKFRNWAQLIMGTFLTAPVERGIALIIAFIQEASRTKIENEKLVLSEFALTWAQAALASDRIFGSSFGPPNVATDRCGSISAG
jgi:hypothetical protein